MRGQQQMGFVVEQLQTRFEQRVEIGFDLPATSAWSVAEAGWIEHDDMVATVAFEFSCGELASVFDDPANGVVVQLIAGGVVTCPTD